MIAAYAVDFESYYDDEVSIKTMGTYNYLRHPKQDIYLATIHGPKGTWIGRPEEFDWDDIAGEVWTAHNASFDPQVYLRLKELFPELSWPDPSVWHCTADLSVYVGAGRALKTAAKQLLGVDVSKAYRNVMKGRYVKDLSPKEKDQVYDAGVGDAVNCYAIWEKYSPLWPEHERRLSLLTREMAWRGVHVDRRALEEARDLLKTILWSAEQKIPWAGEKDEKGKDIPLLSAKMIAAQCRKEGIPPPKSMSKDDPEFDEWLGLYDGQFPWVRAVSEYRRVNTVNERVGAMIARTQENGRMGYGSKYFGAHTGRWSGDGGMNIQNLQKFPLFISKAKTVVREPERIEKLMALKDAGEDYPEEILSAIDIRSMIVAPPGKKFFIPDLSQIEPRCLWWLTGDTASMNLASTGMSPYEVHARASMGWDGGDLKTGDKKKYALAKARVLALGYGAGWLKFFAMAKMYGVKPEVFDDPLDDGDAVAFEKYLQDLPSDDGWLTYSAADETHKRRYCNAWKIVNDFRESNPLLCSKPKGLWATLDYGFKCSRGRDYEIELPSSRIMRYRQVLSITGSWTALVIDSITGQLSRKKFYGGKLCENLVQATARDVFAEAKLRLWDAGYRAVMSVHDELVFEIEEGQDTKPILELMTQTPQWLPGCPIAAEGQVSSFYCK